MRWFYNLNTMKKLGGAFGLMAVLLVVVAFAGLSAASNANLGTEFIVKHDMKGERLVGKINTIRADLGIQFRNAIIYSDEGKMDASIREFDRLQSEMTKTFGEAEKTLTSPDDLRVLSEVREAFPQWVAAARESLNASPRGTSLGDPPKMMADFEKAISLGQVMDEKCARIANAREVGANASYETAAADYLRNRSVILAVLAAALFFAVLCTVVVGKAVANPLAKAGKVLDAMAAGDLTETLDIDTLDEVGRLAKSLNNAIEGIRTTLGEVRGTAEEVATASKQLSSAADEISSGAQKQASSLEETAASLEEITSTVKHNAENARHASQLASGSRDVAGRGSRVVEQAVSAMGDIANASKRIADIITTIDEIAFQTNLLALNAAVEAARAGEQGRGFAVVAAEVRSLAQRSGSAAKEIRSLIGDSVNKVEAGSKHVAESGKTLEEIVGSVKRVTDMVSEIAAASAEQQTGVEQVNQAVTQMDQVTQSNASQTEELSSTAESLSGQAEQLQRLVARFRLGDSGARVTRGEPVVRSRGHAHKAASAPRAPRANRPEVALLMPSSPPGSRDNARRPPNGVEEF